MHKGFVLLNCDLGAEEFIIEELKQLKFNHSVQSIENPLRIKVLRRRIARMKTIINEKKEN